MAAPSLMFEEGLNPAKGWPNESSLDFSAPLSAAVTFDVPKGRCLHVNNSAEFATGVTATAMAIFAHRSSDGLDVSNPGTTAKGNFMHQAIAPAGTMGGLVATGGYELETTEFNDNLTYAANNLLTAANADTTAATGGVLTNAGSGAGGDVQQFVDPVVGVVSRGRFVNAHGVPVLAFWPVFLPGAYA